jgi:sugar phosphate isomerase/epimerase
MAGISRREFGTVVIAGLPLAAAARPARLDAAGRLTIGVATSSFRELPRVEGRDNVDDVIRALRAVRATDIELALANVEPAPPSVAPFMGGTPAYPRVVVLSTEEIAATNASARAALRTWRLRTDARVFEDARAKFAGAGITVRACAIVYNDSFTDDEIEATFRQVKGLGVRTIASPLTMAMAARLAPFAERHGIAVAIHNQVDGNAERSIATAELRSALRLSPAFRLRLDVGNLTASNADAVAELGEHRARVSHVVVKDRLRNGGRSQPFGEGDTPIRAVVKLVETSGSSLPVLVEYDYVGLRPVTDEVAAALQYVTQAAS